MKPTRFLCPCEFSTLFEVSNYGFGARAGDEFGLWSQRWNGHPFRPNQFRILLGINLL